MNKNSFIGFKLFFKGVYLKPMTTDVQERKMKYDDLTKSFGSRPR